MAEKTVKQLQAEYTDITNQNRKAYDTLHGTGPQGGYQEKYLRAQERANKPGAADWVKAEAADLKAKFEKAQAEYRRTQEAKNALKKELDAATAAEKKAQEGEVGKKSAQSAYDKAIAGLNEAAATIGGYKGQEGYIDAYRKAQAAADALTKAGGTASLPAPKITIPPVGATGIDGTKGTETTDTTGVQPNPSLKILQDKLTDPANVQTLIDYQKALAASFGYKGNTNGKPDAGFIPALTRALEVRGTLPSAWQGKDFQSFLFSPTVNVSSATSSSGPDKTLVKSYTVQFDKTQAEKVINGVFQSQLGRDMTSEEFNTIFKLLDTAQKNNPTKYRVVTDSSGYTTKDSKQTGGIDPEQYVIDLLKSGAKSGGKELLPNLKDEYTRFKLQAPEVTKLQANKRLFETAMAGAGPDLAARQKVKESTAYGRGLKELNTQVADYVLNAGGQNSPDEIAKFAQDLYDRGYDLSSEVGLSELQNFIKYAPGEGGSYTGKAGSVVADLAKTAMANGLDLNKNFSSKLDGWLRDINKGEPIDNIKQQIREVAKIGMPDNVKKLIDNGMDLGDIYAPYKNTMASVLELSPDAIDLSDPTLRAAITGQGEVPLYDFERSLRKDNRWQYTNQARNEVSNATQRILQDFGFMG